MSICTQHGTHARLITRFLPICTEFPAEPNMSMGPLEHARILLSPVMSEFQSRVRAALDILFASLHLQPTTDLDVALAVVLLTSVTTLILYYFACGRRHRRTRKHLNRQLADLRQEYQRVATELKSLERSEAEVKAKNDSKTERSIRIFVEGAFDVMHYGHANAFRQARALGNTLIAGVNSSDTIEQCKGAPPLMTDEERLITVKGCKWVDEVIPRTPYVMTSEYLDWVIKEYKIDYVVHGDDPCIGPDGRDVYAEVKRRGMFKSVPRTEGVSTTEIIGRMLLLTKTHHVSGTDGSTPLPTDAKGEHGHRLSMISRSLSKDAPPSISENSELPFDEETKNTNEALFGPQLPGYRTSRFLTTSRLLQSFSQPAPRPITPESRVVYISGGWDMFHAGHILTLKRARELGDYLLVGVYNDGVLNHYRGSNHPILNLNERVLSVLACKYVDDVLIDPPWKITAEMIAALNISVVVTGTTVENRGTKQEEDSVWRGAVEAGIFQEVESQSDLTVDKIMDRVRENHERLEKKVKKKMKAEAEHYKKKHGLHEYPEHASSS